MCCGILYLHNNPNFSLRIASNLSNLFNVILMDKNLNYSLIYQCIFMKLGNRLCVGYMYIVSLEIRRRRRFAATGGIFVM